MTHRDAHLLDLAANLGVGIEYGRLREGRDGVWIPVRRTIRLLPGMHARQHRSVLAHELGHVVHGDVPTPFGPVHARQEHRADIWAALMLIEIDAYRAAEDTCDGHAGAMAVELGVMRSTVETYREILLRTDLHAYSGPRLGRGQWVARVDADR